MINRSRKNHHPTSGSSRRFHQRLEGFIFGSGLVFNQTWEDPAIDRQALRINGGDLLLSIASGGDNVLALALDGPARIIAIDRNPTQIHLLRLKIAAIQHAKYEDFWHLFSLAPAPGAPEIYHRHLAPHLGPASRRYWDGHISLFRRGLGRSGLFGRTLLWLRTYLRIVCGPRSLEEFFDAPSLEIQSEIYTKKIEPRWWNRIARPFANLFPVLLMFGAHPSQAARVQGAGFGEFLATGIRRVLTSLPAAENYFWQQLLLGRYLIPPDYARPENFEALRAASYRIETHIGTLQAFLPGLGENSMTCFNLLDSMDWLSAEQTAALWRSIENAATAGARVLFRTIDPRYQLPDSIEENWLDTSESTWTLAERTGVYARVCLFELQLLENSKSSTAGSPSA